MRVLCVTVGCFLLSASLGHAQDQAVLKAWLSREILAPNRTLTETQAFCTSRVPPIPRAATVAAWEQYATRAREATLANAVYRGEAAAWRDAKTQVEWLETIPGGPGYTIKKLRFEALPGLWIPALLYEPEQLSGKVPVFMNVNGHDPNGKAADYKQIRCINLVKRGMVVLNLEWFGMGQLRTDGFAHGRMNQLDLCGTSGLAPFYLAMKRGLDILLAHEHCDSTRVGVAGLSGGGWQTIIISALDTRVTLSNPVAGYSSFITRATNFSDLGDSEQTPVDLAVATDYLQLTAMMAPRSLLLTYNEKDNCCFASGHALPPLLEAAQPYYKLHGQEARLRSHVNSDPGTHNFEKDNRQALYRMIGDQWYAGKEFQPEEIESVKEVKTPEELKVAVPTSNADFHTLAMARLGSLPMKPAADDPAARRAELAKVVQYHPSVAQAELAGDVKEGMTQAYLWRVRQPEWTIPVVELVRGEPKATVLLIGDAGRAALAAEAEKHLADGKRVLALDPFYFGEAKLPRDYLFALMISTVGQRPLGVQAGQLQAVAKWSQEQHKTGPVTISAVGPRTTLIALTAAALAPEVISRVQTKDAMQSLKEVIEKNRMVNEAPELFCFGLLEKFDIPQLKELTADAGK